MARTRGYAERTMCIYKCDLALEILGDVRYFLAIKERARRKVEFVREWYEIGGRDWARSKMVSMMYPTMGI